jgi:hypothetical protein
MSGWTVETLNAAVTAEIEALRADIRARLRRVTELISAARAIGNPNEGQRRHSASALRDRERPSGGDRARVSQKDRENAASGDRGARQRARGLV